MAHVLAQPEAAGPGRARKGQGRRRGGGGGGVVPWTRSLGAKEACLKQAFQGLHAGSS